MSNLDFERCKALNLVPKRKVQDIIDSINNENLDQSTKAIKLIAINRYAESNIPIDYWFLKMEKDFKGDPRLLNKYNEYTLDIKKSYVEGNSLCLAGTHGVGKTLFCCSVLKKALLKGYSGLYTTLSDVVNITTQGSNEDKFSAKRELVMVDFLVIDEFDTRFIGSENAADLYARSLESVFRTRAQNKLPTIMCTNSPNITSALSGSLKASIESLMNGYMKSFVVMGEDFRKIKVQ